MFYKYKCIAIYIFLTLVAVSCKSSEKAKAENQVDPVVVDTVEEVFFANLFNTEPLSNEEIDARKRELFKISLIAWSMGKYEGALQNQARILLNEHSSPSEIRNFIIRLRVSTDKVYINEMATYLQTKENTVLFIVMCNSQSLADLIEQADPEPLLTEFIEYIFRK